MLPMLSPVMSALHLDAFTTLCFYRGCMDEAQHDISTRGQLVLNEKTGVTSRNPSFLVLSQSTASYLSLAAQFGLTPTEQARLAKQQIVEAKEPSIFDEMP